MILKQKSLQDPQKELKDSLLSIGYKDCVIVVTDCDKSIVFSEENAEHWIVITSRNGIVCVLDDIEDILFFFSGENINEIVVKSLDEIEINY